MAIDTPARIAVLGAGPIGLEAALYARYLGYDVIVLDQGDVCDHVRRWGHVQMFTPFRMNHSPLGRAAVAAHDPGVTWPDPDALLTGQQWIDAYLGHVAETDLLSDHLHPHTRVIAVGKYGVLKGDRGDHAERDCRLFRILVEHQGQERFEDADIVLDCTGVLQQPNWMGSAGIPAAGERQARQEKTIRYDLPDILGAEREEYLGKRVLVVGSGYSAATNVLALNQLQQSDASTACTWVTRTTRSEGPLSGKQDDPLPHRADLTRQANRLAQTQPDGFRYLPGYAVDALERSEDRFQVRLVHDEDETQVIELECDRVLGNVGFRPDTSLYEELQVHQCYATQGPIKLAAALLDQGAEDCLQASVSGVDTLLSPEPHYYQLGIKSYGRNPHFLFATGLQQIQQVFTLIGDRANLDLYQTALPG